VGSIQFQISERQSGTYDSSAKTTEAGPTGPPGRLPQRLDIGRIETYDVTGPGIRGTTNRKGGFAGHIRGSQMDGMKVYNARSETL